MQIRNGDPDYATWLSNSAAFGQQLLRFDEAGVAKCAMHKLQKMCHLQTEEGHAGREQPV
jgi:hypothetical protein